MSPRLIAGTLVLRYTATIKASGGLAVNISPTLNGSAITFGLPLEITGGLSVNISPSLGGPPPLIESPLIISAVPGNWLVVDTNGREIWNINLASPASSLGRFGLVGSLPSGLQFPNGMAYGDGKWFVIDDSGNELWRINPTNPSDTSGVFGKVGNLPSGLSGPVGIGYGDGKWLVSDYNGDKIWRINPDDPSDTSGDFGLLGSLPSLLTFPSGITYAEGKWFVVDSNGAKLWRINPDDPDDETGVFGSVGSLPSGITSANGMGYGDGKLLIVDNVGDELWIINPTNPSDTSGVFGSVGDLSSSLEHGSGISYQPPPPSYYLIQGGLSVNISPVLNGSIAVLATIQIAGGLSVNILPTLDGSAAIPKIPPLEVTGGLSVNISPALDGSATTPEIPALEITGGLSVSVSPTLDGSAIIKTTLELSDFDTTGLDVPILMLVTSGVAEGSTNTVYRDSDNGGPLGALAVGSDAEFKSGQSVTRIGLLGSSIRLWDNPSGDHLSDVFPSNTDYRLRFQVKGAGPFTLTRGSQGGNFSNWNTSNTEARAALVAARATGSKFILAIARDLVALEVTGGLSVSVSPALDGSATISESLPLEVTGGLSVSVSPTLDGSASISIPPVQRPGGKWLVVTFGTKLWRINPNDPSDTSGDFGLVGNFPATNTNPQGITYFNGKWLIVTFNSKLWRINPNDPSNQTGDFGLLGSLPSNLTSQNGIGYGNGKLLVVDGGGNELWNINLDDPDDESGDFGLVGNLPSGLTAPSGIAYGNGKWLVVEYNTRDLWRINPNDSDDESGDFGLVGSLPSGLSNPGGIAYGNGKWLIVDYFNRKLWRINPNDPSDTSGDFGLVGTFPSDLSSPYGIGYEPPSIQIISALEITGGLSVSVSPTLNGSATTPEIPDLEITGGLSVSVSPTLNGSADTPAIPVLEITGGLSVSVSPTLDGSADTPAIPVLEITGGLSVSVSPTLDGSVSIPEIPAIEITGGLSVNISSTLNGSARVKITLELSDFDTTGLDVPILMLVTSGLVEPANGHTIYRDSDNGGPLGALAVGSDAEFQSGQSITRIGLLGTGIRIWDTPSGDHLSDVFPSNTDYRLRFQVKGAGPFTLTRGSQGGHFSNWNTSNTEARAAISAALTEGSKFILAIARDLVALEVTGGLSVSVSPTLQGSATIPEISALEVTGGLTVSVSPTLDGSADTPAISALEVTGGLTVSVSPTLNGLASIPAISPIEITGGLTVSVSPTLDGSGSIPKIPTLRKITGGFNVNVALVLNGSAAIANTTERAVAFLLEFTDIKGAYLGPTRFWSGPSNIFFEGHNWRGGAGIIQISSIESTGSPGSKRVTASIPIVDSVDRSQLLQDWGSYGIELGWLHSSNQGATWERAPMRFKGKLSDPVFRSGIFTVTIETHIEDVDRGVPLYWSHESQLARFPDDNFFEYIRQLEIGKDVRWPP